MNKNIHPTINCGARTGDSGLWRFKRFWNKV